MAIYVSVKNRTNTMGGQDWPKAIRALKDVAIHDRNRSGAYICVFGMAMETGARLIKRAQKNGNPHSNNTEIWKSDFFWPFFTNMSYNEIINAVLDVLMETKVEVTDISVPEELIESFGDCCRQAGLIDENGCFNDPYKLARLCCGVGE